jgi:predicted transcriptional regulator
VAGWQFGGSVKRLGIFRQVLRPQESENPIHQEHTRKDPWSAAQPSEPEYERRIFLVDIKQTHVVENNTSVGGNVAEPKLSKLEFEIMETLWGRGESSIREIQEGFPGKRKPAYTTIQTTVYRMEAKEVVRRVRKVGNFHIFAAAVSRAAAQRRLIDDLLSLFGGSSQPVMAHLIESGKLTLDDIKEAEETLRKLEPREGKEKA